MLKIKKKEVIPLGDKGNHRLTNELDNHKISDKDEKNITGEERFIFRLSLADIMRLTMLGTLIAISKDIFRIPLHLPGHTSIYWMGILVLGKGLIPKFGSGMIMGIVSGILAVIMGLGKEGVFVFFKYFVPGLFLDFLAILFLNRFESMGVSAVCGALISLSKMLVNLILGILLKLPMVFLTIGLGLTSLSHVFFGAIGGGIAAFLIKRLKPRLKDEE